MTVGVVGHVFRCMFDFEFDETMVKGTLGPEVVNVLISHLFDLWDKILPEDPEMASLVQKVNTTYEVAGVGKRKTESPTTAGRPHPGV